MTVRRTRAEISAFVHATEETSRVRSAILRIVPEEAAPLIEFSETKMSGHHGNMIVELRACIEDRKTANQILGRVLKGISSFDEDSLDADLNDYLDDRNRLYLRVDKQRLLLGEIAFASEDTINLTFHLRIRPKSLEEMKLSLIIEERNVGGRDANS